ncbi:receptor-like protein 12 [Chenopodium quinoa]|uniref:Receptor-like protein 12 n=1 Tax=Chenopodium quinoa TaxID=63459 RepID=A0A803LQ59_CHEQI|nr:receptor-like protein 12 [Chenopodium quinoa]
MDEFPHWLHTLQRIQVLDLSSNKLYGHINNVSEHHPYPALQILNLSSNNFSGKIPITYIKNFLAMIKNIDHHGSPQYMESLHSGFYYSIELTLKDVQLPYEKIIETLYFFYLSNNAFEGEIPEYVGQLVAILGLNLSHNRLTGHIPASIGSLSSLDSLDLSSNMLSGRIPHELVSLTFLEVFNVSNNKLEGPIPQGNNFNTFSSDSYKENLALYGDPLPECGGNSTPFVINNEDDSEDQGSTLKVWETIVMGFCTGIVVGLAWGYYMFSVGKPFWLIKLADRMELALLDFFGTSNMVRRKGRRARTRRN